MNRLLLSASILLIVFLTGGLIYLHWSSDSNTKSLQGLSIEVEEGSVKVTNGKGEINLAAGERGVSEPGVPPLVVAQSTPDSEEMKEPDSTPVTPIAATLALSSSTSSEPTIESVTKESYWISGYVLNEDGEYLAKSQISCTRRINGKDKPAGKTVSNEEGYYALEVPGTGFYRLTSSPSNEYFDKTDSTSLDEETKTAAVNFLHEKGAHILRGRVIAKNSGEPIANAEVKLMDYKYNPSAVSGEDGRFVIHNLVEGTYNFRASAEGYMDYDARQRRFQEIADPLAGIKISKDIQLKEYTIKMEDAGAVTVYVVDANQSPVPSTSVTAIPYGDEHDDTHKRADSNGVCAFTNIPPGKVLFQARKDEYGETFSEVVETGNLDSPTEVTIALSASSSISGQIVYKDGPPAAGWEIFVSNASAGTIMEKGGIHSAKIETDDSGNYTIPDLGKGEYKLFLFKHDQEGTHKVFTDRIIALEIGEHKTGVNYEIIEGTETVSGKVIAQDGSPIPGAEVEIHAAGSGDPNTIFTEGFNITDENGEFSVEKILKKRGMMISVSADAYKPFRDGFQMGEYVTITLSPASIIAGIVLDQSTRQPIPGANVILRTKYGRDKAEVTDTNGAFKFTDFSAAKYQIFALADGYSGSQSIPIDTEAGIPTDSIVIEMEEANEFRGIVVDPSGNPIPGAVAGLESRMRILPGDEYRGIVFTESYRTKDDGSFVIPNRGRYADGIIVQHAKFARIKHPLPAEWNNEEPLYIYMSPGGSIEGVVLDEKQEPAVGALIHIRSESDRLFGAAAVIDQNGHYRIDHLPEFNYFVDVEGDFKRISVLVQEGQTIRADISADIPPEVNPEQ